MFVKIAIFFSLFIASSAQRFIGYDCGSGNLNVTTLSLLDVGECEIPHDEVNVTQVYMQLLQINEFLTAPVIQCKLEVHRTIYHCGMFSHVSLVQNGENDYITEISSGSCEQIHRTGVFRMDASHVFQNLKVNTSTTHSVTYAGKIDHDGRCSGEQYSDHTGDYSNVVVQGTLRFTIQQQIARVSLDLNKLHLRSGTACSLSDGTCFDSEGGQTFWSPLPHDQCGFNNYGVLYEGIANKLVDITKDSPETIYSLATKDVTFALATKGHENLCGHRLIRTEHPKLLILEGEKGQFFAHPSKISIANLDIFSYVNSKFIYVERHVRQQLSTLYRDALQQRCNLERQTLKNSLSIATSSPDEFAYNLMKGPGYMAVLGGEVVHIIKCLPVQVSILHSDNCYVELQVQRRNETFYMSPRTHVLKQKGTQINCNALVPSYFRVPGTWVKLLPRPVDAKEPTIIKPMTRPAWKYVNPADLATSGIYTQRDIDDLRDHIMFPIERPSLLNDVARELHGQPMAGIDGTALRLLNDDVLEKISESTWNKVWGKFMTFGTISAGLMAIFIIFQIIKNIVDIIVRGYTLHAVFGWSFHLLGALWSSIAHCLLYAAQPVPGEAPRPAPNVVPQVIIDATPLKSENQAIEMQPQAHPRASSPVRIQPQEPANPRYSIYPTDN